MKSWQAGQISDRNRDKNPDQYHEGPANDKGYRQRWRGHHPMMTGGQPATGGAGQRRQGHRQRPLVRPRSKVFSVSCELLASWKKIRWRGWPMTRGPSNDDRGPASDRRGRSTGQPWPKAANRVSAIYTYIKVKLSIGK